MLTKRSTSLLSEPLSRASACAEVSTCADAVPVSAAPRFQVGDVGHDLRGSLRGLLNVARDLLRGGALLLDRRDQLDDVAVRAERLVLARRTRAAQQSDQREHVVDRQPGRRFNRRAMRREVGALEQDRADVGVARGQSTRAATTSASRADELSAHGCS